MTWEVVGPTYVLVKYRVYGEFGTYLRDTSHLDRSAADEEFLKHVARELWFPGFIFLTKTDHSEWTQNLFNIWQVESEDLEQFRAGYCA